MAPGKESQFPSGMQLLVWSPVPHPADMLAALNGLSGLKKNPWYLEGEGGRGERGIGNERVDLRKKKHCTYVWNSQTLNKSFKKPVREATQMHTIPSRNSLANIYPRPGWRLSIANFPFALQLLVQSFLSFPITFVSCSLYRADCMDPYKLLVSFLKSFLEPDMGNKQTSI